MHACLHPTLQGAQSCRRLILWTGRDAARPTFQPVYFGLRLSRCTPVLWWICPVKYCCAHTYIYTSAWANSKMLKVNGFCGCFSSCSNIKDVPSSKYPLGTQEMQQFSFITFLTEPWEKGGTRGREEAKTWGTHFKLTMRSTVFTVYYFANLVVLRRKQKSSHHWEMIHY